MQLNFFVFETRSPDWLQQIRTDYVGKISGFLNMEWRTLKSPGAERDQADIKRKREAELLFKQLDERDYVILFDEAGRLHKKSEEFAIALSRALESGKSRVVFCIGGPYGFDEKVKARAQARWSLSTLTMNHWIAQAVALEQIYRGLTILKGLPYHNR